MKPEDPPVSVKAALAVGERWVLLRNERDEWELPGGRVDPGDASLRAVVLRECAEELGVSVVVGELLDAYLFEVVPGKRVTIIGFAASAAGDAELMLSDEHSDVGLFSTAEIEALSEGELPAGYKSLIRAAARQ